MTRRIGIPAAADELAGALALRERVFCSEQGVSLEADRDGLDDQALHLVACDAAGRVLGTCRILVDGPSARFGRLCVDPSARGRGLGAELLERAERLAAAAGAGEVELHAQVAARSLYDRAGYTVQGEPFDEEGLEHVAMVKALHGA